MKNKIISEDECDECEEYRDWTGMGTATCSYDLDEND